MDDCTCIYVLLECACAVYLCPLWLLQRSGVAFKVDSTLPNLVNLNEDPQLSEVLLYVLRDGATHVGRQRDDSQAEIQLVGPLIADSHW